MGIKQKYELLKLQAVAYQSRPSTAPFRQKSSRPYLLTDAGLAKVITRLWPAQNLQLDDYFKTILLTEVKKWSKHFVVMQGKLLISYQAEEGIRGKMEAAFVLAAQQREARHSWTEAKEEVLKMLKERIQFVEEAQFQQFQ